MPKNNVEVIAIKHHVREGSKFPCSSYLASVMGGQLICLCCGSKSVERSDSFDDSIVSSIEDEKYPKELFINSTPKL